MRKNASFLIVLLVVFSFTAATLFLNSTMITKVQASPNAGDSWSDPVNVTVLNKIAGLARSDRAIAVDSNGNIHIVYQCQTDDGYNGIEIYHVTNASGTWTWSNVSRIPDSLSLEQYAPTLAIDSNDVVHIVWPGFVTHGGDMEIFYVNNSDGSWSQPLNISKSNVRQYAASIAVDSEDNLHIAYTDDTGSVFYVNRTTDGAWSTPLQVSPSIYSYLDFLEVSITVGLQGKVYIAYSAYVSGYRYEIYVVNNTLGSWGAPVNVSRDMYTTDNSDMYPTMKVDIYGTLHIAWVSEGPPPSNIPTIKYANCSAGVWSTPQTIVSPYSRYPTLTTDLNGKVHVVCAQFSGSTGNLLYLNNTMGDFGTPVPITSIPSECYPHITLSGGGYAHIAYVNLTGGPADPQLILYRHSLEPVGPVETTPIHVFGQGDIEVPWCPSITDLAYTVRHEFLNSGKYVLYRNGSVVDSGIWSNMTLIHIPPGDLDVGVYNFTFLAKDSLLLTATYTHFLTLTPPTLTLSSPADFNYTIGDPTPEIQWWVNSSSYINGSYQLYLNGSVIYSGTWVNGLMILPVTGLNTPGVANVTLLVSDPYGNTASDEVDVSVLAQPSQQPLDITLPLAVGGSVGAVIVVGVAVYLLKIRKP